MAEVKEMADTLAEQMWEALAVFMNQRPDDLTDDHVRAAARESGVSVETSEYAIRMIDAAPLPMWADLSPEARDVWWRGVVYSLMPILAGWSGEVEQIHMKGRN